jgi:hypothetical protein
MQGRARRRLRRQSGKLQGKLRVKAVRKGTDAAMSRAKAPAPQQPQQPAPARAVCRRCGAPGPVGDDGFCEKCEKALEQACL